MPTSSIIAVASTPSRKTATPISVASGEIKTVGIYVASGQLPSGVMAYVNQVTPGAEITYDRLTAQMPAVCLSSPGDYHILIDTVGSTGIGIGAFVAT